MKVLLKIIFSLLLLFPFYSFAQVQNLDEISCKTCHKRNARGFSNDVHYLKGNMICTGCHGGNSKEEQMLESHDTPDWVGRPKPSQIPNFCGRCHKGVLENYSQSPHSSLIKQEPLTIPGLLPDFSGEREWPGGWKGCIMCHGVHGIEPHSLELFESACSNCHSPGTNAEKLALYLKDKLGEVENSFENIKFEVEKAISKKAPLHPNVLQKLESGKSMVDMTRIVQHTLDTKKIEEASISPMKTIKSINESIESAYKDLKYRKLSLIAVWFVILLGVFGLYMKIKKF
jgi:hypothetical protein